MDLFAQLIDHDEMVAFLGRTLFSVLKLCIEELKLVSQGLELGLQLFIGVLKLRNPRIAQIVALWG